MRRSKMSTTSISILLIVMFMSHEVIVFGADVGINYGRLGNDLPQPAKVIDFLVKDLNYKIPLVRLFDPDQEALAALATTNLVVSLGIRNQDIAQMAGSIDFVRNWFNQFVTPHRSLRLRYVTVGNEVIPGAEAPSVLQAMKNVHQVVQELNLQYVQVSTVVSAAALGSSFPPSAGQFAPEVATIMNDISNFLYSIGSPLLINVYPYFAYASDPQHISLDYALFKSGDPVVNDGGRLYYNLFDAIVDAFVAAMVRAVNKEDVKLVVSESGWPSGGGQPAATIDNAKTYNNNLKQHIQTVGGTPRRPNLNLETYIFALFNENQKPAGIEQNFGSFYPDLREVYPLWR